MINPDIQQEDFAFLALDSVIEQNKQDEVHATRVIEALLFATDIALTVPEITSVVQSQGSQTAMDVKWILRKLQAKYEGSGICLHENGGAWAFRTATDIAPYLVRYVRENRKLSRSAQEVLGIIAYHQPVTRTEIESVRGVSVSKGTLDLLMEIGWVKLGKRRETPGRPITFVTTDAFLEHFGLHHLRDLPGLKELKEAGFLDHAGREVSSDELQRLMNDDPLTDNIADRIDAEKEEAQKELMLMDE